MTSDDYGWAPPVTHQFIKSAVAATQADPRILGLTFGGSATTGSIDEFSDLDFVIICRNQHQLELLRDARSLARRIGPLLGSFTGEHVGEPRLLICLYGPPAQHIDLKFVAESELDDRIEDGRILWQRDGALDEALQRKVAVWPRVNPQWIEDRFWMWIHYIAAKIGRGELFDCLDGLAFLRGRVLGPMIAESRGYRASGVRRMEKTAPDLVPFLEASIGNHTRRGCIDALHATVDLYQRLRDNVDVERHVDAEKESLAYLAQIERRFV